MTSNNGRRLRLGVLGMGAAAQWLYLPAIRGLDSRLELSAVCDIDAERTRHFDNLFGARTIHAEYGQMREDQEVDAVAILTPHAGHAAQVERRPGRGSMSWSKSRWRILCMTP